MAVTPKRLRIRDRAVVVLKSIVAGSTYFFTPTEVLNKLIPPGQAQGDLTYMVFTDSGGSMEESDDLLIDEDFYFDVSAYCKNEADPQSMMEKALADVRRAIMADAINKVDSESLGNIAILVKITEPAETDNGVFSAEGLAFFTQRFSVKISSSLLEM